MSELAEALADRAATWRTAHGPGLVLGLSGPQGSGKSTVAAAAVALLRARGLRAASLSLDDLYLPRTERARLGREAHPLLATRGPPGTHDVALGLRVLDAVRRGEAVDVPRFDKRADDRAPDQARLPERLDVLVFEGWCLGVAGPSPSEDAAALNVLEREDDADGRWRAAVDAALAGPYAALWRRIDRLAVLLAPDWETVRRWRIAAEPVGGMDPAALDRFLQHYERLTLRAAAVLPSAADWCVALDAERQPRPFSM